MHNFLEDITSPQPISILEATIPISDYCPIDLSVSNPELMGIKISDPKECQSYIDKVLGQKNSTVAYGGYLEQRKLYSESTLFRGENARNIHLGMDFWCKAGTMVMTPLDGKVHSFKNNANMGDYGPTIILEHNFQGQTFYSLYGHLSLESLEGLTVGTLFKFGQPLATLGETKINVNYAPHLHFQLIMDLQDHFGDYPGVCSENDLKFFEKNCPDPDLLLQLPFNDR